MPRLPLDKTFAFTKCTIRHWDHDLHQYETDALAGENDKKLWKKTDQEPPMELKK